MAKITYYSDGDDEICYDMDHWYQKLEDDEVNSMEIIEMKEDKSIGERWCTLHLSPIDNGECSKAMCGVDYVSQNGVRGKCIYKTFCLAETENKITITTDTKFEGIEK